MKKKLRNSMNFLLGKEDCEIPSIVSETVPDDSLSISEILTRFVKGQPVAVSHKEPMHDPGASLDSEDLEKLKDADLDVQEDYRRRLADKMLADEEVLKKQKQKEELKAKSDAEELEEIRQEIRSRKEKKEQSEGGRSTVKQRQSDKLDDAP